MGSVVRVPLGGRRVRGYVVGLRQGDRRDLKDLLSISGERPVFDRSLLETLRWAAIHYVAPLAALLAKSAPPNLPRRGRAAPSTPVPDVDPGPLLELTSLLTAGVRPQRRYVLGRAPWGDIIAGGCAPLLATGHSVLVVAPTVAEAGALAAALEAHFGGRVLSAGGDSAAVTTAWSAAQRDPGRVVVGTRETAFWPITGLGLAFGVEEGRRGMKDRQTPTTHVREILLRRSSVERFGVALLGSVPTAEAAALPVVTVGPRVWPLVEVVDRGTEPPGRFLTEHARRSLQAVAGSGRRAFVFAHRRGYAPAFRCIRCRAMRTCAECGARPERAALCPRCGAELGPCPACGGARFEPMGAGAGRILEEVTATVGDAAGEPGSGRPIVVGTERDLVSLPPVDLAVVVDADGLILAPNYRAEEDALRLLVRVAGAVGAGRGRRALVQTAMPGHPVMTALRSGTPGDFLADLLQTRARDGFPPSGELLVLELAGSGIAADGDLRSLAADRATVLGPAEVGDRLRWLIQGRDLRPVRIGLRRLVQEWRESGIRVRIDADPIDL